MTLGLPEDRPHEPSPAGQTIAHYQILGTLGRGGMGEVYLAADPKLNRRVALKVLLPEATDDAERIQRFVRESRMAASLSHPNIVTIFETGQHEGLPFLAMEYIKGQSLRLRLAQGPLDLALALSIAAQITEALAAAHAAGVIHRDIKPENVMLTGEGLVKVLDFGLARQDPALFAGASGESSHDSPTVTHLSRAGAVIGTLRYMSPEQVRGLKVDPRSDLFGVGIVLYEMLSGHPPFEAPTWADFASDLLSRDPKPLSSWDVLVPPEVEALVRKCLAKDPAGRPQSARELARGLEALQQGWASGTLHEPVAPETTAPRRRAGRTAKGVAAGLLVAAAAWAYWSRPLPVDSVAVLPFQNASGDATLNYVADGLSETLGRDLGRIQGLTVSPPGLLQRFKGKEIAPGEVAREVKAGAVFTGLVRAKADDLELEVALTAASSGKTLWTQSYPVTRSEVVPVADRLFVDAAYQLGRHREASRARRPRPKAPEAYDLYLRAQSALAKRGHEDVQQAVRLFQEASEKDREFGLAYAGLAEAYVVVANFGAQPPVTVLPRAKEAARRAIELDPALAEAHLSYAIAFALHDFDWAAAERSFRRSLELDPRSARTHAWFALAALIPQKRFEEGAIELQRAVELDPGSPTTAVLQATGLYMSRRYDEALSILGGIQAAPLQGVVAATTAFALDAKGEPEEAIRVLSATKTPGFERVLKGVLAHSYAVAGRKGDAARLARELETAYEQVYGTPCTIAAVHAQIPDPARAFRWLGECRAQRDLNLRFLSVDPRWDPIRSDSRFRDLLKELGLP